MAAKASRLMLHFFNTRYFLSLGCSTRLNLTHQILNMSPDCGQLACACISCGTHSSQE
jgi:hypothetical protein